LFFLLARRFAALNFFACRVSINYFYFLNLHDNIALKIGEQIDSIAKRRPTGYNGLCPNRTKHDNLGASPEMAFFFILYHGGRRQQAKRGETQTEAN